MPGWLDLGNVWQNVREIDLRPIREDAERVTWLALVGRDASAREALAAALKQDPHRHIQESDASRGAPEPISVGLDNSAPADGADLVVLLLDAAEADHSQEWELFRRWREAGLQVIVLYYRIDAARDALVWRPDAWPGARVLRGSPGDRAFLENEFAPAVLASLPARHLSLARYYPLFRMRAAQQLINDTSMANATYAVSTGLAEIVPILDVPFNVADMVVLTKAQAIMAYKLGLALGLSTRWQDHLAAFGGTVGGGFIWRSLARQLVGLIPVWGIIPKVAVAYAGTYVMGQAIMQWYQTGRNLSPDQMRRLYGEALAQGKTMARALLDRTPRRVPQLRSGAARPVICPSCGHRNPRDFNYCGNCGAPLKVGRLKG